MSHSAPGARRLPSASILGLQTGQLIAWQLTALAAAAAVVVPGPARWALCALALAGAVLTTARWQHRWAYEWALTAWEFRRVSRDQRQPRQELPAIDVAAVRIRGGSKAALLHDGSGFAVILSAEPAAGAPQLTGLPVTVLASLAEPGDAVVSALQFVVQADYGASDVEPAIAAARENSGQHTVPRSQTSWVVLRHDPMASGYALSAVGAPADVCASLARTRAARGQRAVQLLGSHGLRAELLTADAARAVLDEALVTIDSAGTPMADWPAAGRRRDTAGWLTPDDGSAFRWWCWDNGATWHVTYRLRRWPGAGLAVLHSELAAVPAHSITTAVTLTRAPDGRLAMTGAVRAAFAPEITRSLLRRRVRGAAASCGASLVPLHGEHAAGVLATLPLGRPVQSGRWPAAPHGTPPALAGALPVTAGGLVIGADPGGTPVAVPLFRADRGTRACVAGHAALSRLLVLRALSAGARVQVATMRPGQWRRLRGHTGVPADLMTIVRPGTPPPAAGYRAAPWLIIDDTGAPAIQCGTWQAVVSVADEISVVPGALGGMDAVVLERAGPAAVAAVAAAFGLADPGRQVVGAIPGGCAAVVLPGSARVARLRPDRDEQAAVTASL